MKEFYQILVPDIFAFVHVVTRFWGQMSKVKQQPMTRKTLWTPYLKNGEKNFTQIWPQMYVVLYMCWLHLGGKRSKVKVTAGN